MKRLVDHIYAHPQRLLLTALGLLILTWGVATYAIYQQHHITRQNAERIAENAKTAHALCMAAAGARDFWVSVRAATIHAQQDPDLSLIARRSNREFIMALTKVIRAADGVAHGCDD